MNNQLNANLEWLFGEGVTALQSLPWLLMLLFTVPLLLMARRRCYPSLYLVFLLLIPAGLAFTVIINPDLVVLVLVIDVVLLGLAGHRRRHPAVPTGLRCRTQIARRRITELATSGFHHCVEPGESQLPGPGG